jgi:hypothetical protein
MHSNRDKFSVAVSRTIRSTPQPSQLEAAFFVSMQIPHCPRLFRFTDAAKNSTGVAHGHDAFRQITSDHAACSNDRPGAYRLKQTAWHHARTLFPGMSEKWEIGPFRELGA